MPENSKKRIIEIRALKMGKSVLLATLTLEDSQINIEGDESTVENLKDGLVDPLSSKLYTPENGAAFFSVLLDTYNNPYLTAVEITD
jgi:hypothetical protein